MDREINKIYVIDDDSDSRESYGLAVEEMNVETAIQEQRVENVEVFLQTIGRKDAIVSDHHLKKTGSYFPTNGAEFISHCYDRCIPSMLVTKYERTNYYEIRPYKNKIPVVLTPDQFNPDSIEKALLECINEFKGNLSPSRKTWRTLVRFEEVYESSANVILPSWNKSIAINLLNNELPADLRKLIKPDLRLFAHVNIDTEDEFELFFTNWEAIKK